VTQPRKVPTVHLPLKPKQIQVLHDVLDDWLDEAAAMEMADTGYGVTEDDVAVVQALATQLRKLEQSLTPH
jgi:hypothetical protein